MIIRFRLIFVFLLAAASSFAQSASMRRFPVYRPSSAMPAYSSPSRQTSVNRINTAHSGSRLYNSSIYNMVYNAPSGYDATCSYDTQVSYSAAAATTTLSFNPPVSQSTLPSAAIQSLSSFELAANNVYGGVTTDVTQYRGGKRKAIGDLDGEDEGGQGYDPADPQADDPTQDEADEEDPIGQVPFIFFIILSAVYTFYRKRKIAKL